jgi:hypothetical protein
MTSSEMKIKKLNSRVQILTNELNTSIQGKLLELETQVDLNKTVMDLFVNKLDGSLGDENGGVQVAANKADVLTEMVARDAAITNLTSGVSTNAALQVSDNTARETAITNLSSNVSTNAALQVSDNAARETAITTLQTGKQDNLTATSDIIVKDINSHGEYVMKDTDGSIILSITRSPTLKAEMEFLMRRVI